MGQLKMKVNEFESCGAGCGIYLIRNLVNQRVYVGQTSRKFSSRWKEYVTITKNLSAKKNVTAIILAMRKYGIDNFDFSILEQCQKDQLDSREQFWINAFKADSHNNYNQTAGGQNKNLKSAKPLWFEDLVEELQHSQKTFEVLAKKYNISTNLVYGINAGRRHYDQSLDYPLRSCHAARHINLSLLCAIKDSDKTFEEIAVEYNCSISTIKRINSGNGNYRLSGYEYPLRKIKKLDLEKIIELLSTTNLSFDNIAKITNTNYDSIRKINLGLRNFNNKLNYPIRK